MKVGIFRRRWSAHGGAERFTAAFLGALVAAGHEVHLFAADWSGPADGVRLHRVPIVRAGSALRTLSFACFAPRLARAAGLGVVVSFERTLAQDVYRAAEGCHRQWLELRRRARRGDRVAARMRPYHGVVLALERRMCRSGSTRAIIVNSQLVADAFRRHYAPVTPSITLVRNGVDLARFHPDVRARTRADARAELGIGHDVALLLVGSGFARKGVFTAVRALGDFRRRAQRVPLLLVAGRGRPGPVLAAARREGVVDRVRLLGVVEDAARLYAATDAFVLPSLYDPASNATLEALAMGLPVVTTRTNGSSEVIEHARSGWLVDDPLDARGLAASIAEAVEPDSAQRVGEAARKAVESLTWDRCLAETLAVCASVRPGV